MIALLLLTLSVAPPSAGQPTQFCWDIVKATQTSTVVRALTRSETEIYHVAERAAAVARGWRVEALKQERFAEIEKKRADDAEARLIAAPLPATEEDDDPSVVWIVAVVGVAAALGGAYACAALNCSL